MHCPIMWQLYIDGASRNNPGLAGAGIYILKNGEPFLKRGFFLEIKTNNQAEYSALLLGLFLLEHHLIAGDTIHLFSDSQLLIRHLKGEYKVKDAQLRQLYICANKFLKNKKCILEHIPRAQNKIADKLANDAIDKKLALPSDFEFFCKHYQSE